MTDINGYNTQTNDINTNNIKSVDQTSLLELGDNKVNITPALFVNDLEVLTAGTAVSNPLSNSLDAGQYDITNVDTISSKILNIIGNGSYIKGTGLGIPSLILEGNIFQNNLHLTSPFAPIVRTKCNTLTGQQSGISSSYHSYHTFSDTGIQATTCEIFNEASQDHTITGCGTDYNIRTAKNGSLVPNERLKIGGNGTTYLTGNTELYGNTRAKLSVTDSFSVTDDTVGFQLLKFSVNNTQILSQIKHIFTVGLEPFNNLLGDIGTSLKKFNTLWIDKINGLTPVGGLYSGLSDGALISGGTIGSLLPSSGLGSLLVPANGFSSGDSFHLVCAGDIPNGDKDDIITITLNQDGVQLAQLSVDMEDSTNTFFELEADFQVRSLGSSGQIVTNFDFTFNKQLLKDFKGSRHVQLSTIDTTSASTLTLTAQFTGQLNSTIQTRLFYLRKQY